MEFTELDIIEIENDVETGEYTFDQLSEEAKENAISSCEPCFDEWWEFVYEDAEQVGLKIKSFNCDRGQDINIVNEWGHEDVAKAIIDTHGNECETYKLATKFLAELKVDRVKLVLISDYEISCTIEEEIVNRNEWFIIDLGKAYLKMLCNELDFIHSREYAIDHFNNNNVLFDEEGNEI